MAGHVEKRGAGNRDWFTAEQESTHHGSRSSAAENVTPNEMTGAIRRRTLTGDLPFLFATYDDGTVREEIQTRLAAHPLIDAQRIRVEVRDGLATLTGAAVSSRERELAEDIAAGTRGVTRVRSEIRVMRA
jgi:osmotically-inducible protein OsmY